MTLERVNGGNEVSFTYDRDDLLIRAGRLDIERTPENGSIVGTALGSNDGSRRVVTRQALNPYGELATFRASTGEDVLFDVTYRRDELGRVVEKTESVQGESVTTLYEYDAAGRLESVVAGGATTTYSYDENGNRIAVDFGGTVQASRYDGQDRLLTSDGASFTYDRSGDLDTVTDPNGDPTGYDYDEFGNLRSVTLPDGRAVTYSVDAMNRRSAKSIDGEVVQAFLYRSQLNPVAELDADGDVVSRFVYATRGSTPDYMVKDGTVYTIVSDDLGSPRLAVDTETGHVVQRLDYDEFGVMVEDTNPGFQPFGFAGGLYDADTGLVRFGARDYDPALGRWTTKDPVGVEGGDTNLYAYVGNDPVNATDPTGRNALSDLLTLPGDFTNMVFGGDSWYDNEIVNWGGWDEVGSFLVRLGRRGQLWREVLDPGALRPQRRHRHVFWRLQSGIDRWDDQFDSRLRRFGSDQVRRVGEDVEHESLCEGGQRRREALHGACPSSRRRARAPRELEPASQPGQQGAVAVPEVTGAVTHPAATGGQG